MLCPQWSIVQNIKASCEIASSLSLLELSDFSVVLLNGKLIIKLLLQNINYNNTLKKLYSF